MGKKKNRGPTPPGKHGQVLVKQVEKFDPIPHITSGDFDKEGNSQQKYKLLIEGAKKRDRKLRVLFSNEASFLHTGFSTYGKEVMIRLAATGKYELAELASYGGPRTHDPRAAAVPWKYYHVMPANAVEAEEFQSNPVNQFGKWKLTYALADFKPDVVICIRDWWMDEHVLRDPLRDKFHMIWMPTVDGYPQKWEWLSDYNRVDTICAYSYFGKRVLEEQSRIRLAKSKGIKPIDVKDVCQPGVDISVFKPLSKEEVRKVTGTPTHLRFCGTVMRNQPRKLFPRIIESFGMFKRRYQDQSGNVILLLHTSIPDVGWDNGRGILETIERQNLEKWVMFSYICRSCKHMGIQYFSGSPCRCPRCGRNEYVNPSTQFGFEPEHFNVVYNLMEAYIQGSIAEGDGMPINEAKAAGVPVIVSDYSAMAEKARNGGGLHIENATLFNEGNSGCTRCGEGARGGGGTMQWRSLFDRKHLAQRLAELFGNEGYRSKLASEARKCAENFYNWDLTVLKWQAILDNLELKDRSKTWESVDQIRIATTSSSPEKLSDEDWLLWCYQNILRRVDKNGNPVSAVDNDGKRTWLGQLKVGAKRADIEKHFRSMMKGNEVVAEALKDPSKMGMNPIQRVAAEVLEAEKEQG